ncbi:MAG: hypothetical protein JSS32_03400 [Verrucomicrobia bacterium]|nr:hypothetical protein [Verrucomicrobiota bacterium]
MKSFFEPWNNSFTLTRRLWLIVFLSSLAGNFAAFFQFSSPLPLSAKLYSLLGCLIVNSIFFRYAFLGSGTKYLAFNLAAAFIFPAFTLLVIIGKMFGIYSIWTKELGSPADLLTYLFTPLWIVALILLYRENHYRKSLGRVKIAQIEVESL